MQLPAIILSASACLCVCYGQSYHWSNGWNAGKRSYSNQPEYHSNQQETDLTHKNELRHLMDLFKHTRLEQLGDFDADNAWYPSNEDPSLSQSNTFFNDVKRTRNQGNSYDDGEGLRFPPRGQFDQIPDINEWHAQTEQYIEDLNNRLRNIIYFKNPSENGDFSDKQIPNVLKQSYMNYKESRHTPGTTDFEDSRKKRKQSSLESTSGFEENNAHAKDLQRLYHLVLQIIQVRMLSFKKYRI